MMSAIKRLGCLFTKRNSPFNNSAPRSKAMEPRFNEILVAAMTPDFAGLPPEFWPGYCEFSDFGPENHGQLGRTG